MRLSVRGDSKKKRTWVWPLLPVALGVLLRIALLGTAGRFHPDEALFATFARSAAVQGHWMLPGALDKPPLTLYASALSMTLFGVTTLPDGVLTLDVYRGELAARLPGLAASILLLALVYPLAKRLWRDEWTACMAVVLVAVSPFALAFSAAAFTDGLMLLMLTLALSAAVRGQWGRAGIWLAAAVGCKQQAILYLPLLLGIGWARHHIHFRSFAVSLIMGGLLFALWEAFRGTPGSIWALAVVNNEPARTVPPADWLPRLWAWWGYGQYLLGPPLVTLLLFAAAVVGARGRFGRVLLAYCVFYLALHTVLGINIYDRYWLPLLAPLALLAANGLRRLIPGIAHPLLRPALAVFIGGAILLGGPAPLGGDRGAHAGIDRVAVFLNDQSLGAIIYDRWLGWELDYYLGAWSDKRRVYHPNARALAADAIQQPDPAPRYFPVPRTAPFEPWLQAMRTAGFRAASVFEIPLFVVYEFIPPPWAGCASAAESSWPVRTARYAGLCE